MNPSLSEQFKVFYHDARQGFFKDADDALNKNSDDPSAPLYSILDQLEDFRSEDGFFRFMLCYPELRWGVDGDECNTWIQSSNPTTTTSVEDYQAVKLAFPDTNTGKWRGLAMSSTTVTLLDDYEENGNAWFAAIGAFQSYKENDTIPGPRGDPDRNGDTIISEVALYVTNQTSDEFVFLVKYFPQDHQLYEWLYEDGYLTNKHSGHVLTNSDEGIKVLPKLSDETPDASQQWILDYNGKLT